MSDDAAEGVMIHCHIG